MKHFYIITITIALIILGSSCNGPSEKKICGTWEVTNIQERTSGQQPWNNTSFPWGSFKLFFYENHKVNEWHRGEMSESTYYWSYNKSNNILKYNGIPFLVEEFSGTMMVLYKAPESNSPERRITLKKNTY